jgi:hypothetical protein
MARTFVFPFCYSYKLAKKTILWLSMMNLALEEEEEEEEEEQLRILDN